MQTLRATWNDSSIRPIWLDTYPGEDVKRIEEIVSYNYHVLLIEPNEYFMKQFSEYHTTKINAGQLKIDERTCQFYLHTETGIIRPTKENDIVLGINIKTVSFGNGIPDLPIHVWRVADVDLLEDYLIHGKQIIEHILCPLEITQQVEWKNKYAKCIFFSPDWCLLTNDLTLHSVP